MTDELLNVLESGGEIDLRRIIKRRNRTDFERLKSFIALQPSINPKYRQKSIYALGRWGDDSAAKSILDILPNLEENERITAIDSLGRLKGVEALTEIRKYIEDQSLLVRKTIVRALGRIRNEETKKELEHMRDYDPSSYIRNLASMRLRKCDKGKNSV